MHRPGRGELNVQAPDLHGGVIAGAGNLLLDFLLGRDFHGCSDFPLFEPAPQVGDNDVLIDNTTSVGAHRAELARRLRDLELSPGQVVYSNYPAAAWLFVRRQVRPSPRIAITEKLEIEQAVAQFAGWPGEQAGYLAWFLPMSTTTCCRPRRWRAWRR